MNTAPSAERSSTTDRVTLPATPKSRRNVILELPIRPRPILFNRFRLPIAVFSDGGGGVRNGVSAIGDGLATSSTITCAAIAGGAIGILSALQAIHSGVGMMRDARRWEDQEGMAQGKLLTAAGSSLLGGAVSFSISKTATLAGASSIANSAMTCAVLPLYGAMNIFFLGLGVHRYRQTNQFYERCLHCLNDPKGTEIDNLASFLAFLKKEVDIPANTPASQMVKEMEKRRMLLERKVGRKHANGIIRDLEGIIKRFSLSHTTEVRTLAYETRKALYRTLFHSALLILVATVGTVAVMVSFVCTGSLGFILFAVAGVIWLAYDIREKISDPLANLFWKFTHLSKKVQKWAFRL